MQGARTNPIALRRRVGTGTTLAITLILLAATPACYQALAARSRVIKGTATARLHLVRAEGATLFERGSVGGALRGSAVASLNTGPTFIASFTIRTASGSITGHGSARPHGIGRYQSFSGTLLVTRGTRLYAHASGRTGLYGVFDRRTDAVVIQAAGGAIRY